MTTYFGGIMYLYKRGDIWYCDFVYRGIRYRKGLDTNKQIALEKLSQWKRDLQNQKFRPTEWASFKRQYLDWGKANKNKSTVQWDTTAFRYFDTYTKIKDINDINAHVLDGFKTWLIRQGKKAGNVNRLIACIKAMMNKAEQWELIEHKNFKAVKKLKQVKGRILFYTPEEVKKLLSIAPDNWKLIIKLGCLAGLRRGEILNLAWEDIDLNRQLITIKDKPNWHPKTYECRDIPIAPELLKDLKKYKETEGYVIKTEKNEQFSLKGASTYFIKKIVKKVGLRGSIHTLRHTFASWLVQSGVDLYTVSKLLGHSSINTTEIYAHLSPNTFIKSIEKLPKI